MKTLQQLKQIIHQSDPSILDLERGCEIDAYGEIATVLNYAKEKNHNNDKDIYEYNDVVIVYEPSKLENTYSNGRYTSTYHAFQKNIKEGDVKILGKPITLENVLKALEKKGKWICVNEQGDFAEYNNGYEITDYAWTLNAHLDLQSPKTWEALIKLLK